MIPVMAWMAGIRDFLLPPCCPLCRQRHDGYCTLCRDLLPWIEHPCTVCGRGDTLSGVCGSCITSPPGFDRTIIPFHYREPVSGHIRRLKYNSQLHHARSLGMPLARCIREKCTTVAHRPDMIVPVPLHWRKAFRRGYNQSAEIASIIAQYLDLPMHHSLLKRQKHTVSQTGLDQASRGKNMKHAFSANPDCHGLHIALVDDVVTSSSTISDATRALKISGAAQVSVWAIARS